MKKITLLVSVLLFFFTAIASAHGPVRQKAEEKITINAPAEKVWSIIKDFGDMSWHPSIANTTIQGGNEKGATRVLSLNDGSTITEELKKHDDKKMSYAYKITEMSTAKTITHAGAEETVPALPVTDYAASIDVVSKGGSTEVIWKAGYYRAYMNNNPPEEMNEATANAAVKAVLETGLLNLKALAEK
ncbi:MAG: SRPBCC family protein [Methylobacter sp.]|nr:SRPBCC family protein [Methylobacter sp.]MDP2099536.1 SRPBCC family protein [Methylobacter sp.]MDP2429423.1 SRPBCC family protein [Methylobacter sp.]MDP3056632.1 SRPBCC family protein [Methylobacter sp.]MDP3362169.1 SRPBCC family protein [Methylobacter sp.]